MIDPDEIDQIILGVGPFENRTLIHQPTRGLEGKFSLEYCTCRALLDRKLGLHNFTDAQVSQPEIQRLIAINKCNERYPMAVMGVEASGLNPQSVTIKMCDGREYFRETPIIDGMPVSPMTEEQIEDKYRDCAALLLDKNKIQRSLILLRDIQNQNDISELKQIVGGL